MHNVPVAINLQNVFQPTENKNWVLDFLFQVEDWQFLTKVLACYSVIALISTSELVGAAEFE